MIFQTSHRSVFSWPKQLWIQSCSTLSKLSNMNYMTNSPFWDHVRGAHFIMLCFQRKLHLKSFMLPRWAWTLWQHLPWVLWKVISIHEAAGRPPVCQPNFPHIIPANNTSIVPGQGNAKMCFMWLKAPANQHFWGSLCETFPVHSQPKS